MCGIAGIISNSPTKTSKDFLDKFSNYNKFRGPDFTGFKNGNIAKNYFGLAHHRLSIIDLNESANQPLESENWIIVFNGEIYNFRELRNQLISNGINFTTNSDTEVILHLIETLNLNDAFKKLNGMFAIAILNKNSGNLILVRDKWGKKPLYFCKKNQEFSFSSDLRSFKHLNYPLSVNLSAIKYYFSELAIPQPDTIFKEIQQVKPGYSITFSNGKVTESQYSNLFKKETKVSKSISPKNVIHESKRLLDNGIQKRLMADVPVGSFLSGGIDSGIIVGLASKHTEKLNTYTVGFEEKKFDERPYAKLVADKFKTNHHELIVDSSDTDLEKLIMEFGEPFADPSLIPSYLISSTVSKHQKVVLSGDGGDELFCGNKTYIQAYTFDNLRNKLKIGTPLIKLAKRLKLPKADILYKIVHSPIKISATELNRNLGFSSKEINELLNTTNFSITDNFEKRIEDLNINSNNIFKSIMFGSINNRLLNDYLVKVDRSSMYASLEIRSPFLDDELFDFVKSLSKESLMPKKVLKGVLKNMAKNILPNEILNKPKTGFDIPLDEWLRTKWRSLFIDYVLESKQSMINLNYNMIRKIWNKHLNGDSHGYKLFSLLTLHIWIENYFRE